ncbi:hypothetical protein J4436_04210 [Candidatus Woesearchaeota archaeon]|nr:hypothetical protein [Candidatus Woesearchaeota archaeon]
MHRKASIELTITFIPSIILLIIIFIIFGIYFFSFETLNIKDNISITKEQIFTLTSLLNTKISIDESIESKELIFSIKDISYTADSIGVSCILNQDNSNIWNIYVYGYEEIKEGLDFKKIGQCLVDLEYSYPDYLDDLDINPILTELNSKNCKEGRTYLKNTYKEITEDYMITKIFYPLKTVDCRGQTHSESKSDFNEIINLQEENNHNIVYKELLLKAENHPEIKEKAQKISLELFKKIPKTYAFKLGTCKNEPIKRIPKHATLHYNLALSVYNIITQEKQLLTIYGENLIGSEGKANQQEIFLPTEDPNKILIIELYEVFQC